MFLSKSFNKVLRKLLWFRSCGQMSLGVYRCLYTSHPHRQHTAFLQLLSLSCLSKKNTMLQVATSTQHSSFHVMSRSAKFSSAGADHRSSPASSLSDSSSCPSEWTKPFQMPEPELDWDVLLDKANTQTIHNNIQNRKGVGDIHKVISLHEQYSIETDASKKEELRMEMVTEAVKLPNSSHPDTVIGEESNARIVDTIGEKKDFNFTPRNVSDLGSKGLRMLREKNLGLSAGPKTYFLEADLARLERALINYTLDHLKEKGFEVISVPDMVYSGILTGCGFDPDVHSSNVYTLHPHCLGGACLAGSAEMAIAGYFMNEEIPLEQLPKRVAAVSRCYRAEADTNAEEKGLYRVHHFTKVEMFGLTSSETGLESEHLVTEFLDIEKELFTDLGLHFRILDMPTQELGSPAYRKFDMEAWMYGKRIWGEISSCSNCSDYQSRRLNIKYRDGNGTLKHVHTVNGTACAVPRIITTIMEQNQQRSRKLPLPPVLRQYMDGQTELELGLNKSSYTFIWSLKRVEK